MVGAFALAIPISASEEAWCMGETLPLLNLSILMSMSLISLAFYTNQNVFQSDIKKRVFVYIARILIAYDITALVVGLISFSLNKFSLPEQSLIALKRSFIIGIPTSMGAIIVDSFDRE